MSPEQQAAYVIAMSACVMAETAAMQAANQHRLSQGHSIAYDEEAFTDLINKHGIHHNAVIGMFTNR